MYANKMSKDKVKAGMRCPTSKKKNNKTKQEMGRERERCVQFLPQTALQKCDRPL